MDPLQTPPKCDICHKKWVFLRLPLENGEKCNYESYKDQLYRHFQLCHGVNKEPTTEFRGFLSKNYGKDYEAVLLRQEEPDPIENENVFILKESYGMKKASTRPKKAEKEFQVSIKQSTIEAAGDGLYFEGEDDIKVGTVFGPYMGEKFTGEEYQARNQAKGYDANDRLYAVCVCRNGKDEVWYDPGNEFDPKEYPLAKINMANSYEGVNVIFQEYNDKMYFKVIKTIKKGTEFMTCYGNSYGNLLNIDMENYYPESCEFQHSAMKAPPPKKRKFGQN